VKPRSASLLLASGIALTQIAAGSDRVSDFVNDYLKKKQIPGCAIMVCDNGKVVLSAGYGIANLEHGVRAMPQTVFQSGSMGKQFTAMAVMMLVEQHKLSLDDPIFEVPRRTPQLVEHHCAASADAHFGAGRLSRRFFFAKGLHGGGPAKDDRRPAARLSPGPSCDDRTGRLPPRTRSRDERAP